MNHSEEAEITQSQHEELERRWKDLQQNPDEGESWEDVKKELQSE
jgi:putative addiction module component (TIGR02574 family)